MRQLVVGDIHGGYRALTQALERANFDPSGDMLISLGDICDGWPEVKECVEFFLGLPNYKFILGNHDAWFEDYLRTGDAPSIWTSQGGWNTLNSYKSDVPAAHKLFFLEKSIGYLEMGRDLYVHGGFNPKQLIYRQALDSLIWNRELINHARNLHLRGQTAKFGPYNRVFVGHTTITNWDLYVPTLFAGSLWAMDTGAGWEGKLSVMDTESCEFWQSDVVADLYPGEKGRRG